MPLYEYRCRRCGAQLEKIRKFSDPPLTTCEECGGDLEQLLSAPAIQFKGKGWYITDYGKSGSDIKPSTGDKADTGKATAEKSEKPAAKSDGAPSDSAAKPAESTTSKS